MTISVRTSETSDHVEQDVVEYRGADDKYDQLVALLRKDHYDKVLVFCGKSLAPSA